jgi:hypothetical protein
MFSVLKVSLKLVGFQWLQVCPFEIFLDSAHPGINTKTICEGEITMQ